MLRFQFGPVSWIALLLFVAPLALLVGLQMGRATAPRALEPPASPVVVIAESSRLGVTETAVANLRWGQGQQLLAPDWVGLVTDVSVRPGAVIHDGDGVVEIDGVSRIAAMTDRPFWRPLRSGDVGSDVASLNKWLAAQGYRTVEDSDQFTEATRDAVTAWASSIGVPSADGSFDPGWVIWLPESFRVATVDLSVGNRAPPVGSAIVVSPPSLLGADIVDAEDQPLNLPAPGEWQVEIEGHLYGVVDNGGLEVAHADLAALSALLPPNAPTAKATLREAEIGDGVSVPATSVMAGATGNLCVWVVGDDGYDAVPVVIEAATFAAVQVNGAVSVGSKVLANPGDVLDDPTCPR